MSFSQVTATPAPAVAPMLTQDPVSMQLQALTAQEIMSVNRLVQLEGDRVGLERQLRSATGTARVEVTRELGQLEGMIDGEKAKIADVKQRIAELNRQSPIATTAPVGTVVVRPEARMFGFSKDEVTAAFAFTMLFPLVLVAARVMWHRGTRPSRPPEEPDRFARLEQAVEAVAIEVERIGESQRFQTKLMTDREASTLPRE